MRYIAKRIVQKKVSTLFRNFWNFFVRFDHHVFVDMLILRAQFPHIFEMMADKLGQLTYMKEKTKSMPQMKNLKFSRIHNQENLVLVSAIFILVPTHVNTESLGIRCL